MAFPGEHVFDETTGCVVDGVEWALSVGSDWNQRAFFFDALPAQGL